MIKVEGIYYPEYLSSHIYLCSEIIIIIIFSGISDTRIIVNLHCDEKTLTSYKIR